MSKSKRPYAVLFIHAGSTGYISSSVLTSVLGVSPLKNSIEGSKYSDLEIADLKAQNPFLKSLKAPEKRVSMERPKSVVKNYRGQRLNRDNRRQTINRVSRIQRKKTERKKKTYYAPHISRGNR